MKSNNSKLFIKKYMRDNKIDHKRITNKQGKRVWIIDGKEFGSLADFQASLQK